MITLRKLTWDNCFSYGEGNELRLDDATLTQLVGTNGVGKSSIPLILEEVLFNKNSKNVKKADIANRYVNKGYDITLDFSVDTDDYTIAVTRRGNIKCKLTKNGEDISSHTAINTYKTLGEILGIDFKTFTQLVYQNTNTSLQFLTATDTNRKKFLIDLLKLDGYVELFEMFKEAVKNTTSELSSLEGKISTVQKWLSNNKLETTTLYEKLNLPKISEDDEQSLRSLQLEIENISEKNRKINTNNQLKQQLKSIDLEHYQKIVEELQSEKDLSTHQVAIGTWKSEENRFKAEMAKYKKLLDIPNAICPTCEQPITEVKVLEEHDKWAVKCLEAIQNLKKHEEELEVLKNENALYREATQKIAEWENLYRSVDSGLPSAVLDKQELENEVAAIRSRIQKARSELEEVIAENEKRERHNTKVGIILEQTQEFENELKDLQTSLKTLEQEANVLEVLKKAFSTNGLLAYKIESLVKELEELTNVYLTEFSDGRFSINFVVENDKLNVEVTDNGKPIDILALSSGELARVNIATLVAIRKLMTSISRSQINVLFLDEVNQALDEMGKEKVVEILLQEDSLNTYLVSHGWTHPLLEKIEIIKEDNISRLNG
jgi:DNA repair exonuclease SbcCD ATPase subunit